MNRECNGDFFIAERKRYYRCIMDGSVFESDGKNGDICKHCNRLIDAVDNGECEVKTMKYVSLNGGNWDVPFPG